MPILDPVSQVYFLKETSSDDSKFSKQFFLRYLKIASRNLYRNSKTIEASIQFKKDFKNSIEFLNKEFECDFSINFDDSTIKDYYQYLYDHISPKYKTKIFKNPKGKYKCFYEKLNMYFFQPFVDYPNGHSWFFMQNPVAILVLDESSFSYSMNEKYPKNLVKLINLEIELMNAAGFTIVFCLDFKIKKELFPLYIKEILATHPFAEIHLTVHIGKKVEPSLVDDFFQSLLDIYDNIKGYFYFYSDFIRDKYESSKKIFKQLKRKPRFKYIFFSGKPYYALKSLSDKDVKPFPFCKTGFEEDQIPVRLCKVILYKSEDDKEDLLSDEIAYVGQGFISSKDFLNFEKPRVKILFRDFSNMQFIDRYINFNDVHSIKPDLYVDETMTLANTDKKMLEIVENIEQSIDDQYFKHKDHKHKNFKKQKVSLFFKNEQMKKILYYASSTLVSRANSNQLLTAAEACMNCIYDRKDTGKGVIYQVETGEGKSTIIRVIAATLALMSKTVHITSSNIQLANRDYIKSFNFFKELGLSSAVLLHYNELPYVSFSKSSNEKTTYDKKFFPRKFFSSKLFQNSSNMNFSVCGITNDNE